MRAWATGVTVVTSAHQDVRHGMTVSSFTAIDVDPALVMVSLAITARTHLLVQKSGNFGVTILADNQQAISDCFAGRCGELDDRFHGIDTFTLETGVPLIAGGLCALDCCLIHQYLAGRHTLFIGEVRAVRLGRGAPLLYYNRSYRSFPPGETP
jgi:flavin reductase (DIM6/NTAB) family NADH-FMN oxidoreductase RutF